MKVRWTAILLIALAVPVIATAQAELRPIAVAQVPPPGANAQKDGPFRLLLAARADAKHRRAQGFHAEPVKENGLWWVVFYP